MSKTCSTKINKAYSLFMREFNWSVRVYYEDTDSGGVVYHTNYLKFMERARTEWLRALGFSHKNLNNDDGIIFVVANMALDFKKPAYIDELLNVNNKVIKVGGTYLLFGQTITNDKGELICRGEVNVVCVDIETFRPTRIPESIRVEFNNDH